MPTLYKNCRDRIAPISTTQDIPYKQAYKFKGEAATQAWQVLYVIPLTILSYL